MARDRSLNEEDWLALPDPRQMMLRLSRKGRQRKWRLFACACCRLVWPLLGDVRSRAAVEAAERFAYDGSDPQALLAAQQAAAAIADLTPEDPQRPDGLRHAAVACAKAALYNAGDALRASLLSACAVGFHLLRERDLPLTSMEGGLLYQRSWREQQEAQRRIVLDVVGPLPFRPKRVDPLWLAWGDQAVPRIAQAFYRDGACDRLPVLADALEEQGCDDAEWLAHLRGGGAHVRGCWAVDLILAAR